MIQKFKEFCASNTASAKTLRTIFQGIVAVLVCYVPDLVTGSECVPAEYKAMIVAMLMAVLAPVQAAIGESLEISEEDVD